MNGPGLYGKYFVYREDARDAPGGDKEGARYFVLDYAHDPAARHALVAYIAYSAEHGDPDAPLLRDLVRELAETERPRA